MHDYECGVDLSMPLEDPIRWSGLIKFCFAADSRGDAKTTIPARTYNKIHV